MDITWKGRGGTMAMGVLLMLAATAGCGGSESTPTQPTRTAELSPVQLSATVTQGPTASAYTVNVTVREIVGQTSAQLRSVRLQFSRGQDTVLDTTVEDAWPSPSIGPGATLASRTLTVRDDRPSRIIAERVAVTVNFVIDSSRSGSLMAGTDVVPR